MSKAMFDVIKSGFAQAPMLHAQDGEWFALSVAQQQVYRAQIGCSDMAKFNLAVQLNVRGALDPVRLSGALRILIEQHDALRISIHAKLGVVRQCAELDVALAIQQIGDPGDPAQLQAQINDFVATPFRLDRAPLFRVLLVAMSPLQHVVVLVWHHIIFDGWSFERFMAELSSAYQNQALIPAPNTRFLSWVKSQNPDAKTSELANQFWRTALANPPAPINLTSVRNPLFKPCTMVSFTLPAGPLDDFARATQSSIPVILMASLHALFARLGETDDVFIGIASAARNPGNSQIIGPFSQLLPIRASLQADFAQQVHTVGEQLAHAITHQHALPEGLPPCSAWLAYQNIARSDWALADLAIDAHSISAGQHSVDHLVTVQRHGEALHGTWDIAQRNDFDARALVELWQHLLARMLAQPMTAMTAHDWAQNNVSVPESDPTPTTLWAEFDKVVTQFPHAASLELSGTQINYRDLHKRASELAETLLQTGAGPGTLVLVKLSSSFSRIVALLAIVKTGAGYVPLDHFQSGAALGDCLAELDICAELIDGDPIAILLPSSARSRPSDQLSAHHAYDQRVELCAYVMFTSGSTGKAKAVAISHAAIVQLVRADCPLKVAPHERILQLAAFGFDGATFEIWGALLSGATLVLLEPCGFGAPMSVSRLAQRLRTLRISTLYLNGTWLQLLIDFDLDAFGMIKRVIAGGDVMSVPHARRLLSAYPQIILVNGYGPTENTVFSTCFQLEALPDGPVPIGKSLPDRAVMILDRAGHALPNGIAGEAGFAGAGLMLGYQSRSNSGLHRLPASSAAIYRSGDRVIRDANDDLRFLGRHDRQVKLCGFRVELDRIEALLLAQPCVIEAMVRVETLAGGAALVAYVAPADVSCAKIKAALRKSAASFEIPDQIIAVARLPRMENGKLDRTASIQAVQMLGNSDVGHSTSAPFETPIKHYTRVVHEVYLALLSPYVLNVDDDFFDAGGNSILAIRAAAKIEAALQIEVSLQQLYQSGSARKFAECLILQAKAQRSEGLFVELLSGREPVYMIPGGHGGDAELNLYREALADLAPSYALIGIRCGQIDADSLSARAAEIVSALTRKGAANFNLIGECVGGILAYEVAKQLLEGGAQVNLMLMDAWCPTERGVAHYRGCVLPRTLRMERARLKRMARRDLARVLWSLIGGRTAGHARWKYLRDCWLTVRRVHGAWQTQISTVGQAKSAAEALGHRYIEQTFSHRPSQTSIALHLLLSAESMSLDAAADWRALTNVQTYPVPGNHHNYLRAYAGHSTQELKRWLASPK